MDTAASQARRVMATKARTSRTRKRDWKPAFLAAFEETGMITRACELAGVGRTTAYEARQRDEDFALAWADADERATEAMERELYRRAVEGIDKPVYQGGKKVGTIREYSDTLLIFGLKARRPEKYRDNVKVEHTGTITVADLASLAHTND